MKTQIVPLIGDPVENLYQLGLKEKEAFLELETRVTKLLSTNSLIQYGQDILSKARVLLKKKENDLFDKCIISYSEGLGIDPSRYYSLISLFEIAAHYGQVRPELKSLLPGCTSVFSKVNDEISHTRLLDFPLIGIFDKAPRIYLWQSENSKPFLSYSCEGMAPLFFQGLHGDGISFALHHKPGKVYHPAGMSIFQIAFEVFYQGENFNQIKKEIKRRSSITNWSFLMLDKSGQVHVTDIDGPNQYFETYNLHETSPLIFTNIPLKNDPQEFGAYLKFCEDRQNWLKGKLASQKDSKIHILDRMTAIGDQKIKEWLHPAATLATVGAYHINLDQGFIDLKEGNDVLTSSDTLVRINLDGVPTPAILKPQEDHSPIELAWKKAARAQASFDKGEYDTAYHELQMAQTLMPHKIWKDIFSFYLFVWDLKFINNPRELSEVYKKVKKLSLPPLMKDQWVLLLMRLEKKLDLSPTVDYKDVSDQFQQVFLKEKVSNKALFATWLKLLYPRMEILEVYSPHRK